MNIASSDPAAPQPPIMNRIEIKFQKRRQVERAQVPEVHRRTRCCPRARVAVRSGSKIGTGKGVGYAKPVVTDPVNAELTIFNGGSRSTCSCCRTSVRRSSRPARYAGGYNLTLHDPADQDAPERA